HKRSDDAGAKIVCKSAFPSRVVNENAEESDGNHDTGARGPIRSIGKSLLAHVIHHAEKKNAGDPSIGRPPSEPVQCAGHELRVDNFLRGTVNFSLKRSIDPIEEVKVSDP